LLFADLGHDIPLLWRAHDHYLSADVAAKIHQFTKVMSGSISDGRIRAIHVEAFWLDQNPMNSGNLDPMALR
jgi:hypothetical protein